MNQPVAILLAFIFGIFLISSSVAPLLTTVKSGTIVLMEEEEDLEKDKSQQEQFYDFYVFEKDFAGKQNLKQHFIKQSDIYSGLSVIAPETPPPNC